MAGRILDTFLVYQFIKRLATPFNKWKAYELGIIDDEGNVLKKRKELETQQEKNAWGYYDILVTNLKKLLAKLPFGRTRLASFAAAAILLKEYEERSIDPDNIDLLEEKLTQQYNNLLTEEVPANNAGAGNIDGIGVGPKGEPGVTPKSKRKYKDANKLGARKVTSTVAMMDRDDV